MTNHPLTDEIIEEIAEDVFCYDYSIPIFKCDMRAAADWQLEQVNEWIKKSFAQSDRMIADLKKAMRPQEAPKQTNKKNKGKLMTKKINGHKIEPGANLRYANLSDSDLRGADLRYADLTGTNLTGAALSCATFTNCKGIKSAKGISKKFLRSANEVDYLIYKEDN